MVVRTPIAEPQPCADWAEHLKMPRIDDDEQSTDDEDDVTFPHTFQVTAIVHRECNESDYFTVAYPTPTPEAGDAVAAAITSAG